MTIKVKNKGTLEFKEFTFKCCFGLKGLTKTKKEGDKKTPIGTFSLGNLFYRADKHEKPTTDLTCIRIDKKMGWCDDLTNKKFYNKLIRVNSKVKHEKLYRADYKYDFLIPINYNKKRILEKGSAIFIHLTKNYQPTAGCVGLRKKDLLILLKLINKKTKIKIY
jgi:L,D-peptidoglycan transpeptidase YkuD (ErfK/YbiS/YcfS/YnhG family)|tara:strand:+ start:1167 stop:1658 length:492 start_codon:yes stop_codon:yes gene_type:complete